jgi:arabinofuranosyltransferase
VARVFDVLQKWLVERMIAVSQQEHRVFLLEGIAFHPPRSEGARIQWSSRYVKVASSVGLVSWLFPNVAVIDIFGLNDWVVARNPILRPDPVPQLAHERGPPPGYVECFRPNFHYTQFGYGIDPVPKLTDDEIRACEARFAAIVAPKH